jgi:hypothetical protein
MSLFLLALPEAAFAAETKRKDFLLTLPPPPSPNFSAFSGTHKQLQWIGLAFAPRKGMPGRPLPPAAYDDRRMNCGKYCVPTYEMERTSFVARRILFGVGAASIGAGFAFTLVPPGDDPSEFAPSFKLAMGKERVSMSALWSF